MVSNRSSDPGHDPRDIHFSVPQVHRLRTTWEVAGDDFDELIGVLHASADADQSSAPDSAIEPPRVLIWADEEVMAAKIGRAHV
jgi:hypothetical protein